MTYDRIDLRGRKTIAASWLGFSLGSVEEVCTWCREWSTDVENATQSPKHLTPFPPMVRECVVRVVAARRGRDRESGAAPLRISNTTSLHSGGRGNKTCFPFKNKKPKEQARAHPPGKLFTTPHTPESPLGNRLLGCLCLGSRRRRRRPWPLGKSELAFDVAPRRTWCARTI